MEVKCVRILDPYTGETLSSGRTLRVGKTYLVLEIMIHKGARTFIEKPVRNRGQEPIKFRSPSTGLCRVRRATSVVVSGRGRRDARWRGRSAASFAEAMRLAALGRLQLDRPQQTRYENRRMRLPQQVT